MNEGTEIHHPVHTAEMEALLKRMEQENGFYEYSLDGLKDIRLQSALQNMLDAFAKLPLTPADKAHAAQKASEALEKANELQERISLLEDIYNGKDVIDPLQTPEYEQALINGDGKKAAKLEAAARQLRIDRHTSAQQIKALQPAWGEAKRTAGYWGRINTAVYKSMLMQELQANQAVFNELLERLLPVWEDMNRLCVAAELKAEHMYQLKEAFNHPKRRLHIAPGLEHVMRFEIQRRPLYYSGR